MRYLKIKVSGMLKYLKVNGNTPQKMWNLSLRKDNGETPALGSLVRVRLAVALLRQWLSERTPAGVSQDWRFECGAGEHPTAHLHHEALWSQITRGPRCPGWGRVPLVLRGDGPLMSKANPPPPQKEAAYGVQIDVGLPCFRNEGLEGIRTWGPAAPEGRTILVPPVHLFGWEGSHCNLNGRASMDKNMEDHTAIQKGRAPTAPQT